MTGIGTAGATLIDDHTAHLMDEPPGSRMVRRPGMAVER